MTVGRRTALRIALRGALTCVGAWKSSARRFKGSDVTLVFNGVEIKGVIEVGFVEVEAGDVIEAKGTTVGSTTSGTCTVEMVELGSGVTQVIAGQHIPAGSPVVINENGEAVPAVPPSVLVPYTTDGMNTLANAITEQLTSAGYTDVKVHVPSAQERIDECAYNNWRCRCADIWWARWDRHCMCCGLTRGGSLAGWAGIGSRSAKHPTDLWLGNISRLSDELLIQFAVEVERRYHDLRLSRPGRRREAIMAWMRAANDEIARRPSACAWRDAIIEGRAYTPHADDIKKMDFHIPGFTADPRSIPDVKFSVTLPGAIDKVTIAGVVEV